MRKYIEMIKKYENKKKLLNLLSIGPDSDPDEILLDTDIYFEEYNDDIIIDKYSYGDSIHYYD